MTYLPALPLWWRFIRVRQWYYFALLPLACAAQESWVSPGRLLLCFALACGSLAFAYGLNAITDASTDRDCEKNPLAGGGGIPQRVYTTVWMIPVVVFGVAWWLGSLTATMGAVSLMAGWFYSGPARLKRLPFAGLLCNHAIFLPLLYFGGEWALFDSPLHLSLVAGCVVLLTQNQLLHELMDAGEDVAAGDRTTAQVLKTRGVHILCILLGLGFAVAAFLLLPSPLNVIGAFGLFAITAIIWLNRENPEAARAAHRWAGLIGSGFYYVATVA